MGQSKRELIDLIGQTIDLLIDYRGRLDRIESLLLEGEEPDSDAIARRFGSLFEGLDEDERKRFPEDPAHRELDRIHLDLQKLYLERREASKSNGTGSKGGAYTKARTKNVPVSNENALYCSFCGKSQHEVKQLIAGPSVFICNECTELCMDIFKKTEHGSPFEKDD